MIDGGAGVLAMLMDGAGVAEVLGPEWAHRVQHLGKHRRGGVGVHVDAPHSFKFTAVAGCQLQVARYATGKGPFNWHGPPSDN